MLFLTEIFFDLTQLVGETLISSVPPSINLFLCLEPLKSPRVVLCIASKTTEAQRHSQR